MSFRRFARRGILAGSLAAVMSSLVQADVPVHPNILFVMVDDLSPKAVDYEAGFDFLKTPNVDRIAREGAVFYEYFQEKFAPGIPTMLAVRTENWKYIHYPYETAERGDIDELYNLKKDPDEFTNRINDPESTGELERLKKLLEEKKEEFGYTEPPYRYQPPGNAL
jgi:arylsulfatase A-like enzyme